MRHIVIVKRFAVFFKLGCHICSDLIVQQVYDFIMAGSEAAGAASGIMNAADPIAMIDEMIAATRRAADDLKKQQA